MRYYSSQWLHYANFYLLSMVSVPVSVVGFVHVSLSLSVQSFSLSTLLLLFVAVPNTNFDRYLQSQSLFNLCIRSSFSSVNLIEILALFTMASDLL
jgi:hypothetical protein